MAVIEAWAALPVAAATQGQQQAQTRKRKQTDEKNLNFFFSFHRFLKMSALTPAAAADRAATDREKQLYGELSIIEADIAAIEEDYAATYPAGNVLIGYEGWVQRASACAQAPRFAHAACAFHRRRTRVLTAATLT